jgi:hypothetical protein
MAGPSKASSPSDQLTAAWEATLGREAISELQKSRHVQISNPTFEDVNHDDITGYITELGMFLSLFFFFFRSLGCSDIDLKSNGRGGSAKLRRIYGT